MSIFFSIIKDIVKLTFQGVVLVFIIILISFFYNHFLEINFFI